MSLPALMKTENMQGVRQDQAVVLSGVGMSLPALLKTAGECGQRQDQAVD
jgi:hypothetical protein